MAGRREGPPPALSRNGEFSDWVYTVPTARYDRTEVGPPSMTPGTSSWKLVFLQQMCCSCNDAEEHVRRFKHEILLPTCLDRPGARKLAPHDDRRASLCHKVVCSGQGWRNVPGAGVLLRLLCRCVSGNYNPCMHADLYVCWSAPEQCRIF